MTDTDRQALEKLLPFYVNGSLSAAEKAEVEAALKSDAKLRSEAEYLRTLRQQIKKSAPASAGELPLRRVQREIARERKHTSVPRWWRPALAAAALVIVVQGGLLLQMAGRTPEYQPLSATARAQLSARFAPGATESAIRQLLGDAGVEITGGPSASGLYHLRLRQDKPGDSAIDAALQKLQANPKLVVHVQRE